MICGDYIQHNVDIGSKYWPEGGKQITHEMKYDWLNQSWEFTINQLVEAFPDTPILSTFGNNDNFDDYMPTPPNDPKWGGVLYEDAFKIWMQTPKANLQHAITSDYIKIHSDFT